MTPKQTRTTQLGSWSTSRCVEQASCRFSCRPADVTADGFPLPATQFVSELPHLVPLKLLQHLAPLPAPPDCTPYLTSDDLAAVKAMFLLNRGRLSVQPVEERAYEAVRKLGEEGGWDELLPAGAGASKPKAAKKGTGARKEVTGGEEGHPKRSPAAKAEASGDEERVTGKRKAAAAAKREPKGAVVGERRSKRNKAT